MDLLKKNIVFVLCLTVFSLGPDWWIVLKPTMTVCAMHDDRQSSCIQAHYTVYTLNHN